MLLSRDRKLWLSVGVAVGVVRQIPLAVLTHTYFRGKSGNMIVWMSLIIGQPVAILMYYHDYYVLHSQQP